mgnify:CR=1 FL=1
MPKEVITTTTSTTTKLTSYNLPDYLDYVGGLSSGEKLFYKKTYGNTKNQPLTIANWEKITNLVKK